MGFVDGANIGWPAALRSNRLGLLRFGRREAPLTGSRPEGEYDMGFTGTAVTESDHVHAPGRILAACEFQHEHLVQARYGGKVEGVE